MTLRLIAQGINANIAIYRPTVVEGYQTACFISGFRVDSQCPLCTGIWFSIKRKTPS